VSRRRIGLPVGVSLLALGLAGIYWVPTTSLGLGEVLASADANQNGSTWTTGALTAPDAAGPTHVAMHARLATPSEKFGSSSDGGSVLFAYGELELDFAYRVTLDGEEREGRVRLMQQEQGTHQERAGDWQRVLTHEHAGGTGPKRTDLTIMLELVDAKAEVRSVTIEVEPDSRLASELKTVDVMRLAGEPKPPNASAGLRFAARFAFALLAFVGAAMCLVILFRRRKSA